MILSLFLVLMLIAVFLIVLGFWTGEGVYSIVGFTFIFLLSSSIILPGNLTYKSGYTEVAVAPCNNNCTEVRENETTFLAEVTTTTHTDNYSSFNDSSSKWFGFWLCIISALGLVLSLIDARKIWGGSRDG